MCNVAKNIIDQILPDQTADKLMKGRIAQIGETRVWSGEKYVKTSTGWKYVGKDKPAKQNQELEPSENPVINRFVEEYKNNQDFSTLTILSFGDLTDEEKDDVLRRINFTGLVYNEGFYGQGFGNWDVREKADKQALLGYIDDMTYYNEPDDDQTWDLFYDDGTSVRTSDFTEKTRVKRKGLKAIIGWGLAGDQYWARDKQAEQFLMKEIGLSKWVNGKLVE